MRRQAPAAARNREPIAEVLAEELPRDGTVLEVASGTGEHAIHFAERFPHLTWQPTDPDPGALASIAAWSGHSGLQNLLPPLELDARAEEWPVERADAALCINMVHISPVAATEGLLRHAGRLLAADHPLILYGPYLEDNVETVPSNLEFDASLKARNAEWGLRNLAWLDGLAARNGLERTRRVPMPANNLILVYRRSE
jgi:SAM-dependent methyltransferase